MAIGESGEWRHAGSEVLARPWIALEFTLIIGPRGQLSQQCPADELAQGPVPDDEHRAIETLPGMPGVGPPFRMRSGSAEVQFVFGDYVLDPERRETRTAPRPLQPGRKSSTCCSIWCRTVSTSSARTSCWMWCGADGSSLKSTLTSHINAARKAIGDSGQEQRLIRTVARKGFRFVGEVSEASTSGGAGSLECRARHIG